MKWSPVDVVIIVIAIFIGLSVISPGIARLLYNTPLGDQQLEILSDIVSSGISIIAAYVGAQIVRKGDD